MFCCWNCRSRYDFKKHVRRLADNLWEDMSEDEGGGDMHVTESDDKQQQGKAFQERVILSKGERKKAKAEKNKTPTKPNPYDDIIDTFRPGRYYKDQVI